MPPPTPELPRGHRVLRVASYNLRDLKDDEAAAARVVRAIAPDVLCLQEVPRHPLSGHRVAAFASRCGLYWSGGHRGSGGTTVLTSLRVTTMQAWHAGLAVPRFQRERGYAVARVALSGAPVLTVASVHLGLDASQRVEHARRVLAALTDAGEPAVDGPGASGGPVGGPLGGPLVVAGDRNEGPGGAARAVLSRVLTPVGSQTATFPASGPRHRLDVILAAGAVRVVPGRPAAPDARDLVRATDHLPVWVDLELSGLTVAAPLVTSRPG